MNPPSNTADQIPRFPEATYRGFRRHDFEFADNPVILVEPDSPVPGRRWVWVAEFFNAFPEFDLEMLRRGWWVAYINVGNTFGCPSAVERLDAFYRLMTQKYGFHSKPVLEGISRGGLHVYNWASQHTECVGLIYGDNPVCDFKSWPGGKGSGPGSEGDWSRLMQCYGFKSEEEALAWPGNPIDNVGPIVAAGIPLVHVVGDADEIVPWEENTKIMAQRVESLGGEWKLFRKPGGLHHPHGPEKPSVLAEWILDHVLG